MMWQVDNIFAQAFATTLVRNWIAYFEIPNNITTDHGCQFESKLLRSLLVTSLHSTSVYRSITHRPMECSSACTEPSRQC